MTDTVSSGPAYASSSDDRNLAFVVYGLLFASPFVFGLTALIAVVIAYVRKREAEPVVATHYRYQIRTFWVAFAFSMIAAVALMVGVGFLIVDLIRLILSNVPQDAWEAVALQVEPRFPVVTFVGLIVFLCAYVASSLWAIVASIIGAIRLGAGKPLGRLGA